MNLTYKKYEIGFPRSLIKQYKLLVFHLIWSLPKQSIQEDNNSTSKYFLGQKTSMGGLVRQCSGPVVLFLAVLSDCDLE